MFIAHFVLDVIINGKLSMDALCQHLAIDKMQLAQLSLCVMPRQELFEMQCYAICALVDMSEQKLIAFLCHALDGDYGNLGDGQSPYLDDLESVYKGEDPQE